MRAFNFCLINSLSCGANLRLNGNSYQLAYWRQRARHPLTIRRADRRPRVSDPPSAFGRPSYEHLCRAVDSAFRVQTR